MNYITQASSPAVAHDTGPGRTAGRSVNWFIVGRGQACYGVFSREHPPAHTSTHQTTAVLPDTDATPVRNTAALETHDLAHGGQKDWNALVHICLRDGSKKPGSGVL